MTLDFNRMKEAAVKAARITTLVYLCSLVGVTLIAGRTGFWADVFMDYKQLGLFAFYSTFLLPSIPIIAIAIYFYPIWLGRLFTVLSPLALFYGAYTVVALGYYCDIQLTQSERSSPPLAHSKS